MDWLGDNMPVVWLGVALLLGGAEMLTLDLVLIMLAVGALGGMVMALAGAPIIAQAAVAAVASVAMLAVVRPQLARRFHGGPEITLGTGKLIGQQGVVTQVISGTAVGRIRLGGDVWTAAPYDPTMTIAEGETVEVLEIRGATAYVHPVARLEP